MKIADAFIVKIIHFPSQELQMNCQLLFYKLLMFQILLEFDLERLHQPDPEDAERGAETSLHLHLQPRLVQDQLFTVPRVRPDQGSYI